MAKNIYLIESKLAETLHGVADGGGCPSEEEALGSLLGHSDLEPIAQRLVFFLVDLQDR